MLRDDLPGWDGDREVQEGGNLSVNTADSLHFRKKLTQHWEAIILQLKHRRASLVAQW